MNLYAISITETVRVLCKAERDCFHLDLVHSLPTMDLCERYIVLSNDFHN